MLEILLSAAGLLLAILASNDTMKDHSWLCSWRRLRLFGHGNQAVVFLTHTLSDRIYNHFLRLKKETRVHLDSFLCLHRTEGREGEGVADFIVARREEENTLPARFAEKMRRGGSITPGFVDLAFMPALLSTRLSSYEYLWTIEYDVDFAGHWSEFFMPLLSSRADLMGTTFYSQSDCPGWDLWAWFKAPEAVSRRHYIRSFGPIVRFSRRMLKAYVTAVEQETWRGHFEALFPAIASYNSFALEDLGGNGPFTPTSRRGKNYINTPSPDGYLTPGTFVHAPAIGTAYFHEAPERFSPRGYLWHPIKPGV
jgi:hypothetical protein